MENTDKRGGEGKEKTTNQLEAVWFCGPWFSIHSWTLRVYIWTEEKNLRFTHLCTSEASPGPLKGRRPFSGAMTRIFEWSLLHGRMGTLTVPVVLSHSMDKDVCICVFKVSPPQDLSLSVLQKTSASVFLF